MAPLPAKPRTTGLRLSHGPTQFSGVSEEGAAKFRYNGVYYFDDISADITPFGPNIQGYVNFPTGPYTYRMWNIALIAPAAIAGVTTNVLGEEFVNTNKIADYIDGFAIEINGASKWELFTTELVKLNAYQKLDTTNGFLRIPFGSPNLHNSDIVEDAYQFGTSNLKSVRLRVKTKTAWVPGMKLSVGTEYAKVSRPLGYFQTTVRTVGVGVIGQNVMNDIAVGKDFSTIWIQALGVQRLKLTIDREKVLDCTNSQLRSLHDAWGKDMAALGDGIMFDSFRDGDGVGIDSVSDQVAERARGADTRIEMTMLQANPNYQVVVFNCGLYAQQ